MSEPEVGPEPRHLVLMTVLRVPITSSVKLTKVCEGALQPPPPVCTNTHHLNPPFSPKAFLHVYEVQNQAIEWVVYKRAETSPGLRLIRGVLMLAVGVISRDYRKSGTFPELRASTQNPDEPLAYTSQLSKQP